MTTMKSVPTGQPGKIQMAEIERPVPGPRDLLMRIRACGICATDATFVQMGGMPLGPDGQPASGGPQVGNVLGLGPYLSTMSGGRAGRVRTSRESVLPPQLPRFGGL